MYERVVALTGLDEEHLMRAVAWKESHGHPSGADPQGCSRVAPRRNHRGAARRSVLAVVTDRVRGGAAGLPGRGSGGAIGTTRHEGRWVGQACAQATA